RPASPHEDRAEVANEGREDVASLERVGAAHRAALLAQAPVEAAHDLALTVEVRELLLDHAVEEQPVPDLQALATAEFRGGRGGGGGRGAAGGLRRRWRGRRPLLPPA